MTDPESTAIDSVAAMGTDHTEAPAHPLHKVLSFVRRSGRLDDRLQRAWDNYAGTYLLDIAAGNLLDVREGVTLDRAFVESAWGNDNPLIVEIGTGQGENALAQIHAGERHHDDEQQNAEQNPRKREVMEDIGLAEEELGLGQVHKIENDRIDDAVDDAVTDDALIQ